MYIFSSLLNYTLKLVFLCGATFLAFVIHLHLWSEHCFFADPYEGVGSEYDYVVVGAGTAGCVLALRLAEADKKASVLLIEAGPIGSPFFDVPSFLPLLQLSPLDWQYETVPQDNAGKAWKNNVIKWPRGRLLGGTGRFNNMLYVRGDPADYAAWYKDKTDYAYEKDVFPYLKMSENQRGAYKDDYHHGQGGPLYVDDLPFRTDLTRAFLNATEYLGYPTVNINGGIRTGFGVPQVNVRNGARYSTAHHLLDNKPANLHILTSTHVRKIRFLDGFEASAVEASRCSQLRVIKGTKAIVLSAGAVDTPKLLLLSGVGNKNDLQSVGITAIKELPVGENLHDHVTTGLDLFRVDEPLELNPLSLLSLSSFFKYFYDGKGPWTCVQVDVMGYVHTKCLDVKNYSACSAGIKTAPDLQVMVLPMGVVSDNGAHLRHLFGISDKIWSEYYDDLIGTPTLSLIPILTKPKSRGYIKLADNNPLSKPLINPRYLSHPDDIKTLIQGLNFVKKISETPPLKELGIKMYNKHFPGCETFMFASDDYWRCYITHMTMTVYHPVGTAKMGHENDPSTVVDYNFKVLGMNKLFIADASVIPEITSANTNAPTVLIAEKAAESILKLQFQSAFKCKRSDILFSNVM